MQLCRPYIYIMLIGLMGVNVFLAGITRAEIAFETVWSLTAIASVIGAVLWSRRHAIAQGSTLTRTLAAIMETMMLILMLVLSLRYLDHITKVSTIPLADPLLNAADAALGLNWIAYWEWIHAQTALHPLLIWTYGKIEVASIVVTVTLFAIGQGRQGRIFLETLVLCGVASVVIGAFFPAIGPVSRYLVDHASYINFQWMPGTYHLESFAALRDPAQTVRFGTQPLVGLTTMPSMHTATAIAMIALTLRTWIALPTMAFAIPMLIATPVWGGHYFVDIIFGSVMALVIGGLVTRSFAPEKENSAPAGALQGPMPA